MAGRQKLSAQELSEGERHRRCVTALVELRIELVRSQGDDPRYVAVLESELRRAKELPLNSKRHARGLEKWAEEWFKEFRELLPPNAFELLQRQLIESGLANPEQFKDRSEKRVLKVMACGSIRTPAEYRAMEDYAEALFQGDRLEELERVNQLLADYHRNRSSA